MGLSILTSKEALAYTSLAFNLYRQYLLNCDRENIIAVGATDEAGKPCGLILALTTVDKDVQSHNSWTLCSIFVTETQRKRGIGRRLWIQLHMELEKKGCREIRFQAVLRETMVEIVTPFFITMGFPEPNKIAKIFAFTSDGIQQSPFVTGSLANAFQPDANFRYISFDGLSDIQIAELEANEGGWYPHFVSPFIGKECFNEKCTIFAVDVAQNKLAGWITAMNVNENTRVLYRSFFTREEYRDTPVGFFIFTQAIKNHLKYYRDRGGLSSIPTDNERALRFSTLFFRNTYDHISYEIESKYQFVKKK